MGLYHIAATLGYTVAELGDRMTTKEYLGWIQYFHELNADEKKPNLLDSPDAMLQGFGL